MAMRARRLGDVDPAGHVDAARKTYRELGIDSYAASAGTIAQEAGTST